MNAEVLELYVNVDEDDEFFEDPGSLSRPLVWSSGYTKDESRWEEGQVGEICLEIQSLFENLQRMVNPGFVCFCGLW